MQYDLAYYNVASQKRYRVRLFCCGLGSNTPSTDLVQRLVDSDWGFSDETFAANAPRETAELALKPNGVLEFTDKVRHLNSHQCLPRLFFVYAT